MPDSMREGALKHAAACEVGCHEDNEHAVALEAVHAIVSGLLYVGDQLGAQPRGTPVTLTTSAAVATWRAMEDGIPPLTFEQMRPAIHDQAVRLLRENRGMLGDVKGVVDDVLGVVGGIIDANEGARHG